MRSIGMPACPSPRPPLPCRLPPAPPLTVGEPVAWPAAPKQPAQAGLSPTKTVSNILRHRVEQQGAASASAERQPAVAS